MSDECWVLKSWRVDDRQYWKGGYPIGRWTGDRREAVRLASRDEAIRLCADQALPARPVRLVRKPRLDVVEAEKRGWNAALDAAAAALERAYTRGCGSSLVVRDLREP